jgi:hypothetical protein
MSSNRLTFDKCAYNKTVQESTYSLGYNMFIGKYEPCNTCATADHPTVIPFDRLSDVESELFGIYRPNTLCPSGKYDPKAVVPNEPLTPARLCHSIYYITPNNLERPKTNMLNEVNLTLNATSGAQCKPVEKFANTDIFHAGTVIDCPTGYNINGYACEK